MFLYPLVLGILSVLSPFLGLAIVMSYIGRTVGSSLISPLKSFMLFFVVPLGLLFWDKTTGSQMMALDAIFAVGVLALVYLYVLKRNHVFSEAFMVTNLVLVAYGLLRFQLFSAYQAESFEQGILLIQEQMPAWLDNVMFTETLPLWKMILPAIWIIGQSFALLIGFLLFQKTLKVPNFLANMRFPGIYNLLIIAILPLYLLEQTKMFFFNALIGLCVIPFLQGVSVMWQRLGLIFANRIVLSIFMVIIILYASIILVLIGFGDMWLQKQKPNPGGTTA